MALTGNTFFFGWEVSLMEWLQANLGSGFIGVISFFSAFGEELVTGKSTKMEWHLPVYAGERLSGRFWVSKVEPRGASKGIVEIQIEIRNQDDKVVLTGLTEGVMRRRNAH